MQKI
jgi:hypothetical protein